MKNSFCCAYCGETEPTAFNREHIIPRAFGAFYDPNGAEVVLSDRVCSRCNSSFKQFEQRHTRESMDVFFRNKYLVKGRKPNEIKPNPYKKKKDGRRPVIVKGQPPGASHDIFLQMDSQIGLTEPTAAHFIHPKSGELIQVELQSKMTRDELKETLNKAGYENGIDLNLHCRPGDEDWFKKLFEKDNIKLDENPKPYGISVYVEGGYRKEDFRSIAKIGFNYMLKFNNLGLTGRESYFDAIRAFIRDGVGNQFAFCEIPSMCEGPVGFDTPNHFLALEANRKEGIVCKAHLFATPKEKSPFHMIKLGSYPFSIDIPNSICAHRFQIESGSKDSGKVFTLS